MRIASPALTGLLLSLAVPSMTFAQILDIPVPARSVVEHLDHVVPVASVTRADDPLTLLRAQRGDGFVLGDAQLDLKDPSYPKIAFTVTNSTTTPIPLMNIYVSDVRVTSLPQGTLRFVCKAIVFALGRWAKETALQPGAALTVEMGTAPRCGPEHETLGFLISIRGDGPPDRRGADAVREEEALLAKAFTQLRSRTAN